jgi:hypothetical protein
VCVRPTRGTFKNQPDFGLPSQERFQQQVQFLRRQFLQDGGLPFTNVLSEEVIAPALAAVTGWLDRVFSPLITLWVFLGQVLGADHSCRAAVARPVRPIPATAGTGTGRWARGVAGLRPPTRGLHTLVAWRSSL